MAVPHLIRTLGLRVPPMYGTDAEAVRRGTIRYLEDDGAWKSYQRATDVQNRTFGPGLKKLVERAEHKARIAPDGKAGPALDRVLRKAGAYDAVCDALLVSYEKAHSPKPANPYCYPHPEGSNSTVCQGVHPTAGLDGNYAIDFCARGDTPNLAVIDAEITKISGHPPTYVVDPSTGIFGWNVYYVSAGGYRWFSTHYGYLSVRVGQRVRRGQIVGRVGHWPGNEGRSHLHLGVSSPHGRADAERVIRAVAASPRIPAV